VKSGLRGGKSLGNDSMPDLPGQSATSNQYISNSLVTPCTVPNLQRDLGIVNFPLVTTYTMLRKAEICLL
jgi:hypothetical protein